ncbi:hypothetical protein EO763_23440 (plasmid) [Pectobacterium odoriferum]|uniref:hypothetical protein n=1 Tax=Pectobacterium TaxID=122277 RepID=UPI00137434AD|nr:hypothetical protein [Pectobacterium odoriferum]QHP82845.1 hypothetical protein EO763_23440 [Pectobacterium odoriferum]
MDIFDGVFMGVLFVFNHIANTAAEVFSTDPFGGVVYLLVMLVMIAGLFVIIYHIAIDVIADVKKFVARRAAKAQG